MQDRIKWIEYKGKKILYLDYSNLDENEFVKAIEQTTDFQSSIKNQTVHVLCDVTNTRSTPKVQQASKKAAKIGDENGRHQVLATVGLNAMQRIIANAIRRGMYFAKNHDEAKEWLLKN